MRKEPGHAPFPPFLNQNFPSALLRAIKDRLRKRQGAESRSVSVRAAIACTGRPTSFI